MNVVVLRRVGLVLALLLFLLAACQSEQETSPGAAPQEVAEVTGSPTATAEPTDTPAPTATETPLPTDTPTAVPTNTPMPPPTNTPAKQKATATPDKAKPQPLPTKEATGEPGSTTESSGEIDARQLITDSEEKSHDLDYISLTQNVNVEAESFSQHMTQTCHSAPPDRAYCLSEITVTVGETDPIETSNEMVQIEDQLWAREEEGEWMELPPEFLDESGFSSEGLEQITLSEFITGAELSGETTIDDVPVYEITFDMDIEGYFATVLGEETAAFFVENMSDSEGSGRMWIGQKDSLPRKALVEMSFAIEGETLTMTTQVAYHGFNKPVEFPDPTAETES